MIPSTNNLLLLSLSLPALLDVVTAGELVHLDIRENIIEPQKSIKHVDFPESGVMSFLRPMEDGSLVEVANIGHEGMVGVQLAFGVSQVAEICFCQVEGSALRIEAGAFVRLLALHPELGVICQRYTMTLLNQIASNFGCNRTHSIEERCAKWLLMAHDRCHTRQFTLTQESLAMMLCVSRTMVNLAAGILAKAQLISYVRGKVTILDRAGLENVCCPCYATTTDYFAKVMGQGLQSNSLTIEEQL